MSSGEERISLLSSVLFKDETLPAELIRRLVLIGVQIDYEEFDLLLCFIQGLAVE